MRIAYLSCVMPPYPGGIGVAASGMAQEMADRGHTVVVFTSKMAIAKSQIPNPKSQTNPKFQIQNLIPWIRFGNAGVCPQVLWRLRNFDIVHLLYPFYGAAELMPLLRRTTKAKIVMHHMMDAVAGGALGAFFRWHTRTIAPRIFRAADRVLVLSEDYAHHSEVAKLGVQWEVVPHGVDTTLFKPMIHDSRFMIPTILFVGGLDRAHYFKGVPVLIEACRILRDQGVKFQCQIAGDGELRKEYEKTAEALNLKSQISNLKFIGLVPHDQLPAHYQRAAVCVVPSTERIECFSIVAAEAQACGVPAIVTDFPGVRVTIENGVTGFVVPPNNAQALAERIQWILDHPQEARQMGQAGRQRVEQMYSWKVVVDKLEQVYASLHHP